MAPAQAKPTRKRNRKRKRRVASDSSSSSDDNSSNSGDSIVQKQPTSVNTAQATATTIQLDDSGTSSSSSSSSDDSSDDSIAKSNPAFMSEQERSVPAGSQMERPTRESPSPPPTAEIRPFVPTDTAESEQALKEKFRKFWMASLAEGFKDDLEQIRKEPNFGPSRLALLVESLAAGADVFSSNSKDGGVNEMEVALVESS